MRVELLGRTVMVRTRSGARIEVSEETDRWLVMALALDGMVTKRGFSQATRLAAPALRKRVERLRDSTGLPISTVRGQGYQLELDDGDVDVRQFVMLVDRARVAPLDQRRPIIREARALWYGGLPGFVTMTPPAPTMRTRLEQAYLLSQTFGRRILIIDDQIADQLAAALRVQHECVTARTLDEYQALTPTLAEFDLVVLDRHLQVGYRDSTGDVLAEQINLRADNIPVFMMTYKLPAETELLEWQLQLGLAGAIEKARDGDQASVGEIAREVNALFERGAVEMACDRIEMSMVSHRRRIAKLLESKFSGAQLQVKLGEMNAAADRVIHKAKANDLAGARFERAGFLRTFEEG